MDKELNEGHGMKLSKFNIYKLFNSNEYWVYNTFTTALVILQKDKFFQVRTKDYGIMYSRSRCRILAGSYQGM